MEPEKIRTNSAKAWLLAARPKTLTAAAIPVLMALSLAWPACSRQGTFKWTPAILCLLFAFVMQIDANFVNDYFDFRRGTDDKNRLGPRRACAQGWITPRMMTRAIILTTAIACAIGLPLVLFGGWHLLLIGIACVAFCFLYTLIYSYIGLGDLIVLLFFGIVPLCTTYYIQTGAVTTNVFLSSIACGLVIDTLLVVNNYRDRDNDRIAGKRTLVVLIGKRKSEILYISLGIAACALGVVYCLTGRYFTFILPLIYLALHSRTFIKMKKIGKGKALNMILAENSRNMFIYGILFSVGVLIDFYLQYV